VYEPEKDENGDFTGKSFLYSFGMRAALHSSHYIASPDIREFRTGDVKLARLMISMSSWEKIRHDVEKLQQALLHGVVDEKIISIYENIIKGTCVNFALNIFGNAYREIHHQRLSVEVNLKWQSHILQPIFNSYLGLTVSPILRKIIPDFVKNKALMFVQGYIPWVLSNDLKKITDPRTQLITATAEN
jgi:hypothetical protein